MIDQRRGSSTLWLDLVATSFEQRWFDAAGVRTRALVTGPPDAPPLVFLHGIAGHAEAYVRNLEAHGAHFRTYSIDMLGHGWTDKPDRPYEIEAYVDHLVDFLYAAGHGDERAIVSGESLGGWVAAKFAVRHPDRIAKLVLNTAAGVRDRSHERLRTLTLDAVQNPSEETVRARLEWLMKDAGDVTDELVEVRRTIYSRSGIDRSIENILVIMDDDVRPRNIITDDDWAAITTPTLVLWTTHDPGSRVEVAETIASKIAGAELTIIPDCGHWPQWEDAEEFNRRHLDFLLDRT